MAALRLISLSLLVSICSPLAIAVEPSLLDSIRSQLLKRTSIKGEYHQAKFVRQMETTLDSSGRFFLDRKKGLEWHQEKPFTFTMKLTIDRMEMQKPGEASEVLTKDQNPMVFTFSRTFLGLFSGDIAGLTDQFDIEASGSEKSWTLDFAPKAALTKKAIKKIVVQGSDLVNKVMVEDRQGNTMSITFSSVQQNL